MQVRTIRILASLLIITLLSCGSKHNERVFKYFHLRQLTVIRNILNSDKKALNNVIIELKDGDINIVCVPFTRGEYDQKVLEISKADQFVKTRESIELEMSGRKLKGFQRIINQSECSIFVSDYYEGVAFFASYSGNCNISTGLKPILGSIKYHFSKETVDKARNDFMGIMNAVENMNVPTYGKAFNVKSEYTFVGLAKEITYQLEIEPYSLKVLEFYKHYFAAKGWKPYYSEREGNWFENKLFFTWVDRTGEILSRLLILSERNSKDERIAVQSILTDVTPYLIMEWGKR